MEYFLFHSPLCFLSSSLIFISLSSHKQILLSFFLFILSFSYFSFHSLFCLKLETSHLFFWLIFLCLFPSFLIYFLSSFLPSFLSVHLDSFFPILSCFLSSCFISFLLFITHTSFLFFSFLFRHWKLHLFSLLFCFLPFLLETWNFSFILPFILFSPFFLSFFLSLNMNRECFILPFSFLLLFFFHYFYFITSFHSFHSDTESFSSILPSFLPFFLEQKFKG